MQEKLLKVEATHQGPNFSLGTLFHLINFNLLNRISC
ncbi:MAG: hypothetical protein ACI9E1_000623 [Cryomorphaceae bacterium]|jgi:hypothetical protein